MAVDIESLIITTVKPGTPPAKKPRLFRVACLSLIWLAATICALLFTAYPANASLMLNTSPGDQNYTQGTAILDLQLPAATGGPPLDLEYILVGPGIGDLPEGLSFDPDTRILSGTPSTPDTTTLTYTAFNPFTGAHTNATFTVTVSAKLSLTAPANQNYSHDLAISVQLPAATGGIGTLTYTLTGPGGGDLPASLSFNASTRILSGTPSTPGTTILTYRVTDADHVSANATFTVTVNVGLALNTSGNQNYTLGTAIPDLQLPAATGSTEPPLTYTLTGPGGGDLPEDLSFDPDTRILSGTPSTAGNSILTYTVTDSDGASTNATFTVTVNAKLSLTAPTNQKYSLDFALRLQLPAATGGTTPLTYTLTGPGGGDLPEGLSFTPNTRILSGWPSTPATTVLTYTVTDANGASTNTTFTVSVSDGLALNTSGNQNYTLDTEIDDLQLPAATGSRGTGTLTYTLTSVPGLTFDPDTRILSGTPSTPATTTLTYTATDFDGASANATFTVTVNVDLALTAPANQNYSRDLAISVQLPAATGGIGTLTYTLTGPGGGDLPEGLIFTPSTRILSGTPSTAATTILTYRVTDADDASTNATFTVRVNVGLALNTSGNQNYTLDTAIPDLQLPAATGGTGTLTYTLTGPGGGDLPAGLIFDPDTRTLSGTPSTPATTTLTYRVTDADGASTNVTFRIRVYSSLTFDSEPANQNYSHDLAISVQLPVATGGIGRLTYTLTGPGNSPLPEGLEFDADTRILSGTPSGVGLFTLTYTVTDANGASTNTTFRVTVPRLGRTNQDPRLETALEQNYTLGIKITDLQLPAATGGTAPLTYILTGLPPGLIFNASTRTLSGTPNRTGAFAMIYEVIDAIGRRNYGFGTAGTRRGVVILEVFVSPPLNTLTLNKPADENYTLDTEITDLQLPAVTGGTGTLTYTLTGLPPGLIFNASTRTLSGTPSRAGNSILTYMVTDANGASTNTTFTVMVNAGLALNTSGNQNYMRGTAILDLQLPEATGGTGTLTYTLTGLPAGLIFDPGTRTLSGTPSRTGTTALIYTATETNGASRNATFTVTVNADLGLDTPANQSYTLDTAIPALQLPAATGGIGPLTYTLTALGGLPAGLIFDASTRTLSGMPSAVATTALIYTVTDTNGASRNTTFTITVNSTSSIFVLNKPADKNYTRGIAITDLRLPAATGGTEPLTYTLTAPGGLPAGLIFNASTRTLSGTPSTTGTTTLTYRVSDTNGASTNMTFRVMVNTGLALNAPGNQNYQGRAPITDLQLPEATGGTGTLTYTLTAPGGLPAGLIFDPSTRTLSGTPILQGSTDSDGISTIWTYTVSDINGASTAATFTVSITLYLRSFTVTDDKPANQNYTLNTAIIDWQLPAATEFSLTAGGPHRTGAPSTRPLTYTLTAPGGLPAGLNFNPETRTLSGTPSTAGTFTLMYHAFEDIRASNGGFIRYGPTNGDATFTVMVRDGLALNNASDNQAYNRGTLIPDLQLPAATGTAPLTYTLTAPGGLPAGLSFDPDTRILSGTPSTTGTTTLTYTVTDTNGASTTATFTVTVNTDLRPDLTLAEGPEEHYTRNIAITNLQLPAATGGTAPLTYTLTGVPAGLIFDPGTRTLSGTPSGVGLFTLTYTVTDAFNDSRRASYRIRVGVGLTLNTSGHQDYVLETAIPDLQLPAATGGTAPLTYTLTAPGGLPAGLSFNASTRTLSGTPRGILHSLSASPLLLGNTRGIFHLTYTVTDSDGISSENSFRVRVGDGLVAHPHHRPADQNYTQGTAIPNLQLPETTGPKLLPYFLTGQGGSALPAGLDFDPRTGTLSGTPNSIGIFALEYRTAIFAQDYTHRRSYVYSQFTIRVNPRLALTAPNQNYTRGTAIPDLPLPEATGGTGTLTYTLTGPSGGALPGGLTFNADTRTLSGTPSTAGNNILTYTVSDTNGASTSMDFMVIVSDGLALTTPANQNYTLDTAITGLTLPEADGGTGTLRYTLTGPSGDALPGGLTFSGRTLSGTPDTADTTVLTYTVTDDNGATTSVDFTVSVSDSLTLNARGDQNYTLNTAITALELPVATGGTAPLTYTLTSVPGLNFAADTRILSGTPDTPATTTLTYTVTDTNGATTSVDFMVIVSDGLALTAPVDQNYTLDTAITGLTLPEADGGTGTLRYTLTGPSGDALPGGLTFSGRTLSGTPDTADTTVLTYTVTDDNGATTSVDFTVSVSDSLTLNARGDQNYTLDTAITGLELPVATGGTAPLTYTLTSVSGLNFAAGTRTLSGTPSTAGTTTLTYTVTDDNGASKSVDFTVIVSDGLALTAPVDQNYTLDTAITGLTLPEATGGTAPLTYTLTGPSGDALPGGLTFSGRTLSGTPDTADTTTLTYTVTDDNGASKSVDFMVIVSDGLALTTPANQNYTLDTAITGLTLPEADGGTGTLRYTLTGPSGDALPGGLTFSGRTLSGTPDTADTTVLTYTVTDDNGATTSVDFTVSVSDSLTLNARGDQNYTLDTAITGLTLPVATGGTAPLTYTLTSVSGLNFAAGTRTLSGTPDTAGTTTLTYTVTDDNGATTSVDFTVSVSDGLALTAPVDQNYTLDTAITGLTLPEADGGTGTRTYTLTGPGDSALPEGLEFDVDTRILSGTPSTPATTTLTYTVTDDNGASKSVDFTVSVSDSLTLTTPANQNYTLDTAITGLTLPVATGGTAPLTYTLTSVSGLNFAAGTRTLSGTPSTAGTTTLTYTVTDDNGASKSVDFMVIVSDGLALTTPVDQNYTLDTAITGLTLPEATGGTAPLTYTLTGPSGDALPGGLTFSGRTLSGTPDTADTTVLTYTVTDDNGATTSVDFTVSVSDSLTLNARGDQNYTLDTAITGLELPEADGGTGTLTYTLTGPGDSALPGGLEFEASTRTLSGTPSTAGTTTLTYTVTDDNGASTTATFTIIVSDGLALTAPVDQNYTLDTAITGLELPEADGGTGTLTYTLTGPGDSALPGGLEFEASTRTLSGTPSTAGTTTLTYTVTDDNGASTTATFTIIVSDGLALTAPVDQNYTLDTAITGLTLPEATGGTAPLTYTLTGPSGDALPGGLTFSGRTLSGTPDTADTTVLTYTVTDDNGATTSVDFTVSVSDSLTLNARGDQNYTLDTAITALELPVATGGTAPLTYTLTSVSGLNFAAGTRTLSGTPSTAGTTTLTYTVTDDNGASKSVDFMVIVSDGLALTTPANQNYTLDTAITGLTLPEADGGTGTLRYTLTGPSGDALPGGLTFSGRTLSGTPDTADTTVLTYTVTDDNGATTSVDFTVSVSDSLTLNARGDQNYTLDTAITGLTLPVATGGTAPLTYTLTSVSGLNFAAGTRTLSGTPDTAGTTTLTYTVTDDNGATTSVDFTVSVSDGLALTAPVDQNYTLDTAITGLTLPEADGGTGTRTYTLTGPGDSALPEGLEFDVDTRILSGTPSTPATTTLTYTVTDDNGASKSVDFTVSVSDSLTLTTPANQNYTLDTAITGLTLPVATGGTAPLTYTLTSVSGLNFAAGTRTLSGTPSTAGTTTLTYTVTDDNGASKSVDFMVIVSDGLALTTPVDQNYTLDTAITGLTLPEATGGTAPLTYTLTGPSGDALPGGLTFSGRTLSGTPDTADTTVLTYTVTDDNGATTSVDFTVSVSDSLTLNARGDQNYTLDTAITGLELPEADGGTGTLTYTLTGPGDSALPGGLEFEASTRTLSGTPSTAGTTTLTYTVTDDNGASTTATFTIIVSDGLALTAPVDQNYTLDTAITGLELPEADGGTGTLTYTLTGPGDSALPGGLEFEASTRTLSGTPSTAGTTTLTYTVTDDNGASTTATFTIIVSDGLALTAPVDQNYTLDTAITGLELPEADGGTGTLTYTLTGPGDSALPGGLTFSGRTLSGTPDTADTTVLTYTVTDDNGATTSVDFTVSVSDSLTLNARGDQNYTLDTAITALELPVATGGTMPLTYTLTSVPGLNFAADTRTLSGTPSTPATTTLTYTVTDDNGASKSVDFMVIVSDGLALTTPANQNYTLDTAITGLELPEADGGTGTLTYTLTGPGDSALPGGLEFEASTRTLSGTPSTAGTTTLTYTVTDDNGASKSVDFMVIVSDGLALTAPVDQNYTRGTEITALPLPEASGGTGTRTYTLTGPGDSALPGGLDFNADTRTLSGTPSTPATTTLTYTVTDDNGANTSVDFMVIVSEGLALTAPVDQNYTEDKAIPELTLPEADGGTGTLTYTLTGPGGLPGGLTFSGRILSGTPDTADTTVLTYTVTDTNGANTSVDFTVIVSDGLALTASGNQTYTLNTEITALPLPEASGGTGTRTYTLTGPGDSALPGGLDFNADTRTLSGTPSTPATTTLTYTVTDDNGANTSVDFMVIVSEGLALTAPVDQNYTEDKAIPELTLPEADGGTGTLTYTLTGPGGLPGGLTFSGRILSGTPDTADTTVLTYTVTDTNGANTSVDFTVSVSDGLALTASGNQTYTLNTEITALPLPEASGGTGTRTYTLTGPGDSALPGGLDFNADTRTLSGTPSTPATTTLTYTVTDTNGATTSVDFMVIVSDGLALTAPVDQNYTLDTAITGLELPEADGGTGTLTYTLTGPGDSALPGGLDFNADTRTLSGTPSTPATTTLTYTVTDTNGATTSVDFMVIVSDGLALTAPVDQNYTLDTAITGLELPVATGGTGTLVYTLTSVPGLDFNADTRTLSGTPSTPATTTLTYTVTDTNGATTSVDFMVIVSDGLALTAPVDQNYTLDTAITGLTLPVATGGTGTLTYTLTGPGDSALPGGLEFEASTRILSGTPDTADTTVLTYTVTDTNGANTSVDFTVIVSDGLALTASGNQTYTLNTAITALELPVATGGTAPLTYTLTSVPGLNFAADTRILSGTPDTPATTTLTYTVTDDNGASTTATFTIIVSDGLALSARGDQNYTLNTAITALELPEASGGTAPRTYTLTSVPGLEFDVDTRILSGTPDTADTTVLTYTVTDANGASTTATFTVMVNAGLALTTPANQNYTLDTAITGLTLPVATGGTAPLTYTLTSVSGLNFAAGTRILSGTPSTPATTTLTYTVTDANGASTTATFTIIVSDGLALTTPANQNYTEDKAITELTLPEASGGTGTRTYTLTGPGGLPEGLEFDVDTRILSGTPDTADTTVLTYTVTDTNGASTTATFTVMVNASLTLTASGNQNYTLDTAITGLTLPVATGGTAPLTYTLTSVSGLNFAAGTRILSGTPDTADTTTLTYTVTDDNGATTTATFTIIVSDSLTLNARGDQNYTQDKAIPDLELPEADGGTGTLTYTLTGPGDSPLPGGLTFSGRTLSGTPDTADTTVLTYTVTDDNGASTTATFTIIVSDSLTLNARGDQNYTLNTAITELTLPEASGGTAPRTYTLTSVPGLDFNADTRILSGTPSTPATTTLTYTVTDANGASTTATFTIIVSDGLALTTPANQNYTEDKAITELTLPEADGGTGTLTYTLTGPGDSPLPGGLTFSGRTLSGTPDTADTTVLTYTVTDDNGATTSVDFTVSVSDSLTLNARGDQNYTLNTAITALELPEASGGTAPRTYTLTSVPGLDFNADTRILSGTPDTADTTTLTYRVTDANGATTSVDFMVIVSDGLALSARGDQNYTQDKAIPDLELPEASGGTGTRTYTLTGPGDSALPGGLTFSGRTLSGTPDTADTTVLTYTVTDTNGASTTATFTVMVNASLTLTASGNQNYTLDTAITGLTLPVATGGTAPLTYTLTSVSGLNFAAGTRILSGTPDTADTTTLTYRVTDDNGATTSVDFMVIVSDGLALSARGDQNYTQDKAIPDLELPEASGGTGTRTYTLTGPGDSALPGGLTFSGRTLSGTPDTADTTVLTYTVTDTNGASTTATFTVMVNASLTLTASGNQNYTFDTEITALELPEATGGTGTLTYTLTSVPGLNFNANTRTLSGTPSTADTFDLTYTVTDANDASTTATFTIIVSDGLALSARGDQNYTFDTEITALELPEADGGTGTLTYTLTGPGDSPLPGGLTFSGRTLSGTPDTAATTILTYTVTDTNGANTSVDFTVSVSDGLALSARGDQNYTFDTEITALELPEATGGTGTLTYTLTSVPGLNFNANTRTLSGTPSTADTFDLTYTVTDANDASTTATFTIIVSDGLALDTPANQNYTEDKAITALELPEADGGTGTLTYTLTGPGDSPLPGGLTFSGRTLSGTPDTAATTILTYTVTDTNGANTSVDFTVSVSDGLALSARGDQNYTFDTEITALELPEATGGTGTLTYTLTSVPGLNFNANTRTLSGTPSTPATTTLTYTVTDANGASTTATFTIIVSDGLALTTPANQNYTEDKAITALELPEADGGTGTLTYTLTGPGDSPLPGGLTFSGRTLSGTPDTAATTILTYTVTDTNGCQHECDHRSGTAGSDRRHRDG